MQEMTFASPKAFYAGNDFSDRKCFSKGRQAQASIDRLMMMITKTGFCKGFSGHLGLSCPKYLGMQGQACSWEELGITVQFIKAFDAGNDFCFLKSFAAYLTLGESKVEVFDFTNRTVRQIMAYIFYT
jgi:hypothetical protein